jgi:hypothetical protein
MECRELEPCLSESEAFQSKNVVQRNVSPHMVMPGDPDHPGRYGTSSHFGPPLASTARHLLDNQVSVLSVGIGQIQFIVEVNV